MIAGWPADAVRFHVAQGTLHVETATRDVLVNGAALPLDVATQLAISDVISHRGEELVLELAEAGDASTALGSDAPLPQRVVLQPLPRGGRITFTFADGERAVYLPGRRYQLVATLLQPPAPHAAGEFVPDHVVVPLVWSDDDEVGGRQEINVLLTRCRHDLVAAGIAPHALLERAPGGRATRIVLAPGAEIRSRAD